MKNDAALPATSAIKQTRVVMFWKLVEFVALALFIVIVPRWMGPELYGNFAVLFSLVALLTIACSMGGMITLGRFVPEYTVQGEGLKTRILFTQIFIMRIVMAVFFGIVFIIVFPIIFPQATLITLAVGAGALLLGTLASTCYHLFYGLNLLGRWRVHDALHKFLLLGFLLVLGGIHDFNRAGLALVVTQFGFLLLGLFLTRQYFTLHRSVFNFGSFFSYLRFGLAFFSSGFLLMVVWRGGETVISIFSGQSSEVAFFNVAISIAIAFSTVINQLAAMIIPSLTAHHVSGNQEQVSSSIGYSLKYLSIASFFILFAVYAGGTWVVDIVLGEQYLPVVLNLKILIFGLLPLALVNMANSMAIVQKQPGKIFRITAGALGIFILTSTILVPRFGSYGASIAVVMAMICGGVIAFYQFSFAASMGIARFWRLISFGLIAASILMLPFMPALPAGLLAILFYIALLFWGDVISVKEVRQISRGLISFKTEKRGQ